MSTSVKVSSKGQIAIPAEIRRSLGIHTGDELTLVVHGDEFVLKKASTIEEIADMVSSWIPDGIEPLMDVDAYYQAHRDLDG